MLSADLASKTAPPVPVIGNVSSDDGPPTSGNVLASPTVLIEGTAEAGSDIAVSIDGQLRGVVATDASGHWAFDDGAETLIDGKHTIAATASDLAGNVSAPSYYGFWVKSSNVAPYLSTINGGIESPVVTLTGWASAGVVSVTDHGALLSSVRTDYGSIWRSPWTSTFEVDPTKSHSYTVTSVDLTGASSLLNVEVGTPGQDVLTAVASGDQMIGGHGGDIYVLSPTTANNTTIWYFVGGSDKIQLDGFDPATTKVVQIDSTHWQISDGSHTDTLHFWNASAPQADDFYFYTGERYYFGAPTLASPYLAAPVENGGTLTLSGFYGQAAAAGSQLGGRLSAATESGASGGTTDPGLGAVFSGASTIHVGEHGVQLDAITVDSSTGAWSTTLSLDTSIGHDYLLTATNARGAQAALHLITGTAGADTITPQEAGDVLIGGGGGDTFVLAPTSANSVWIEAFTPGQDHIVFQGFDPGTAKLTQVDSDHWRITDAAHDDVFRVSQGALLDASDYVFDTAAPGNAILSAKISESAIAVTGWANSAAVSITEYGSPATSVAETGDWSVTLNATANVAHTYAVTVGASVEHLIVGSADGAPIVAISSGDYLLGRAGGDTFVLNTTTASDTTIGGFVHGQDHIDLVGFDPAATSVTQVDPTHWQVSDLMHTAVFHLDNAIQLTASDYYFG